jgi:hypothetical protein
VFHPENDWNPERSWMEYDMMEAAELERQADEPYRAGFAALRTSEWVQNHPGVPDSVTPEERGEIQQGQMYGFEQYRGFSGFSAAIGAICERESEYGGCGEEDPFSMPPIAWTETRRIVTEFRHASPTLPELFDKAIAEHRPLEQSPCAHRGRTQRVLEADSLQKHSNIPNRALEVNGGEPIPECHQFDHNEESDSRDEVVSLAKVFESPDFGTLISEFNEMANKVVEDVSAANKRFFAHGDALLEQQRGG